MSFDYNKHKNAHSSDSFWTSYSDLFLGLSTIFLLLYVTSSLRTGTDAIRAQVDSQKLTMENEELKNQLKMYESVKQNYMKQSASKNEVEEYNELMDKLSLLKEEASSEKERLAIQSLENERKAEALNKYQQMIRNIINANKVAKTKIITRNSLIDEQDSTIEEQQTNIGQLETDVAQKRRLIEEGEAKIAQTNDALENSQKKLLQAYKANQISKKSFDEKARRLNDEAEKRVAALQAANQEHIQDLKDAFNAEKAAERAAFDAELKKSNMTAQEKARRLAEFKAEAAAKEGAMANRIAGLQGKLGQTESELNSTRGALANVKGDLDQTKGALNKTASELNAAKGALAGTKGELENTRGALNKATGDLVKATGELGATRGALAKAKEEMDARREVAREIKRGFAGAGIKADVDMQTGEVVLDFGNHYFESDSANLKNEMKQIIEKAMPVYSRSLFGNHKIANKISAVEIIGFASPTYKGRFVDPKSSSPEDRAALKYNMDLSYRRANSIFNYLVEERGEFEHKQGLMSLMKVSGRSFLDVMKANGGGRMPTKASDFCKLNDCKRAQRVIVRFSMDGKK